MATEKQLGRYVYMEIQPNSSGSRIGISAYTRDLSTQEQGTETDTTVRESTALEGQAGFPDNKLSVSTLFRKGAATPIWDNLTVDAIGSIWIYPEGKNDGAPEEASTYKVLGRNRDMPYNDVISATFDVRLTSAITYGTYEAP